MFDTIILLTGPAEHTALAAALRGHRPQLTVHCVTTPNDLAALELATLSRARLLAFATPVIVPPHVLRALGYGAYNFHPGPPRYPGWAPAHFALYEQAVEFGATVHAMAERVDSGPIVEAALFPIPPGISVLGLEGLAYAHLAQLFWKLAKTLATQGEPLPEQALRWGTRKYSRRAYQAICDIPPDITREDLDRRMRAFCGNHWGMLPTIHLHGVAFRAVVQDVLEPEPASPSIQGDANPREHALPIAI
jgi:methionyl-tRNA formyltransferase